MACRSTSGDQHAQQPSQCTGGRRIVATYNHAFTIAFTVAGSKAEDGEDVTAEQMAAALQKRINDLMANNEMLEAVGAPFDTFEED